MTTLEKYDAIVQTLYAKSPDIGDRIMSKELCWCEKDPFRGNLRYTVIRRKEIIVGVNRDMVVTQENIANYDESRATAIFEVVDKIMTHHGYCGNSPCPGNVEVKVRREGHGEEITFVVADDSWRTFDTLPLNSIVKVAKVAKNE